MDVNEFVANARAVRDTLSSLLGQDPASIAAQAASPAGLAFGSQLGLLNTLAAQLPQGDPSLTNAADVPAPSIQAAAAGSVQAKAQPEAAVRTGPSYRLIKKSGNAAINQSPARRRLSHDVLANVFGHLHPWELTPLWRPLGTPLFHQSAANYTHLAIDCEDKKARHMWETMPLDVAHKWGKRSTNIREIKHRNPEEYWGPLFGWRPALKWCRGTWTSLIEGHAIGRAAIAAKKRIERAGGEGAAAASDDDGHGQLADDGTLEKLSFEDVQLDIGVHIPYPPPSSDLPPAPSAPVQLPALTTIDNSNSCLDARVGRNWHTPAVRTLSTRSCGLEGERSWLADCKAVECVHIGGRSAGVANALSALPTDGQSLAALRTLRCVRIDESDPADIDRLREVMVARGVKRSVRELEVNLGSMKSNAESMERCERTAQLIDAVAHPDAVAKQIFRTYIDGSFEEFDVELLSQSRRSSPTVQKIIGKVAKIADKLFYNYRHGPTELATITDDTFPAARTLRLRDDPSALFHGDGALLADSDKKKWVLEIASHMPNLSRIEIGDAGEAYNPIQVTAGEVWRFLESVHAAMSSRGRERSLSVRIGLNAKVFIAPLKDEFGQSPCLWGRGGNHKLPPIEEVSIDIQGGVASDKSDTFYNHVMATVISFNDELKGHKRITVTGLSGHFQQRFLAEQAALNLSGGPYKLSFHDNTYQDLGEAAMCVERRDGSARGS